MSRRKCLTLSLCNDGEKSINVTIAVFLDKYYSATPTESDYDKLTIHKSDLKKSSRLQVTSVVATGKLHRCVVALRGQGAIARQNT